MKTWIVYDAAGHPLGETEAEHMKEAMTTFPGAAAATVKLPYRKPHSRSEAKRLAIQMAPKEQGNGKV